MTDWFGLVVAILATWRVAHLVSREDGPFDGILILRQKAGNTALGRLMDCPYCLSLWIAAPVALLLAQGVTDWLLLWLGVSGGACLAEKVATALDARAAPPVADLPSAPAETERD